jgi:prepilin-type N-terminal cleavage/methylation domain-containing protein
MSRRDGFTAVELLVAIVVGALLLGAGYQLYSVILRESNESTRRSIASGIAYELVRQKQGELSTTKAASCTTSSTIKTLPADSGLGQARAKIVVSCPYSTSSVSSPISLVTATVSYTTSVNQEVSRAIAYRPQ